MLRTPSHPIFSGKRRLVVFIFLLCVFVASAAGARAWLAPTSKGGAEDRQSPGKRLEAEIITLTSRGFEPAEIVRPRGSFLLMVDNRSGSREMNLRLDREAGQRLREARVPREALDWSAVLDLEPGRYALSDATQPDWVCHVTVTPR